MTLRKHNNTPILLLGETTTTIQNTFTEKRSPLTLEIANSFENGGHILSEKEISLVLLRLDLSDTSGFKTLKKYLNNYKHIPVIVLLDKENDIIENQAIKAGAQDVLILDQFNKSTLKRAIHFALQRFEYHTAVIQQNNLLRKQAHSYKLSQRIATFGNWELNLVNNKMEWSEGVFNILEMPHNQTASLATFLSSVFNEDKSKVEAFFERCTKDNRLHKMEFRILVNNSKIKHVLISCILDFDEKTGNLLLIGGLLDITDQKSIKQNNSKIIPAAVEKFKKQAIENFYFQIRTPLSSIGNLLFLTEKTNLTNEQKDYLSGLKASINELTGTLYSILNYSALSADTIPVEENEFDLSQLLNNIKILIRPKAITANTTIIIDSSQKIKDKIITDDIKLAQILNNLLSISLKHAYPKDIIEVNVDIVSTPKNELLNIHIKNNGREWTKRKEKAPINGKSDTEISLTITKKLIKSLHGTLDTFPARVFGTAFSISIPIKIITENQPSRLPDFNIKILLVEDHFLNQIATRKVLTVWSPRISVDIAQNGMEGIAKFKTSNYDLILMDIQMPVMNGIDAARIIRKTSKIPIIALTAESSEKEREKCANIGMNDYLTKPFKPQELYNVIQKQLTGVEVFDR